MNKRKEILTELNKSAKTHTLLDALKGCIELDNKFHKPEDINRIDDWFYDCIKSLFYRPSEKSLVIINKSEYKRSAFVRNLLWVDISYSALSYDSIPDIHNTWIAHVEDAKMLKDIINTDGFSIQKDESTLWGLRVEKRLCNPVFTSDRMHPSLVERKKHIVLYVKEIDLVSFLSIDKKHLWIEIYNSFLGNNVIFNLFTEEDIDSYYGR